MDSLRISLIIIGIIILLLLYFGSRFRQKKSASKMREMPLFEEQSNNDQEPKLADEPAVTAASSTMDEQLVMVDGTERPEECDKKPSHSETAPTHKKAINAAPAVIALHIMAKEGHFVGAELVKAANLAAMRYGEMGIFHFLGVTTGAVNFSMANMLEPGTFDMENLDGFTTPGVLLFMESGHQDDLPKSLDSMAKVAQSICGVLDAQLCDDHRQPFDVKELSSWKATLISTEALNKLS